VPQDESTSTPSQRVRLCRQAGLPTRRDDIADSEFLEYNLTGFSDGESEDEAPPHPEPELPLTPPMPAETAVGVNVWDGGG
jgi:hypothetical protein